MQSNSNKVPAFSFLITDEIKGYKVGETLSNPKHMQDFFVLHVEDAGNEPAAEKLKAAKPAQVLAVLKALVLDTSEDALSVNAQQMEALIASPLVAADSSQVPPVERLRIGTNSGLAVKYGAKVSDASLAEMDKTISAILDANAGPLAMATRLKADFKDATEDGKPFLSMVPPVGSQYRPSKSTKGNRAPIGYRLPNDSTKEHGNLPVWNGPFDKYEFSVTENGQKVTKEGNWIAEFTGARIALDMGERVGYLRDAASGVERVDDKGKSTVPTLIQKEIQAMKDSGNFKAQIDAALSEASFQFNRRVRIVGDAFRLIAAERAITERWPNVSVELYGVAEHKEAIDKALRRVKPLYFVTRVPTPDKPGEFDRNKGQPLSLSKLKTATERLSKLHDKATVADLLAPKKKGTAVAATGTTAKVPAIATIVDFQNVLSEVHGYLKIADKTKMILERCNDPNNGPEFCSAVSAVFDALQEVMQFPGVAEKALAFEASVLAASKGKDKETAKQQDKQPPVAA